MADYNIHVFEKHTREYDRWFETHTYAYESEVLAVRSLLPRSGKGLEVGVGTGRFAPRVGIKVGVEPAQPMASIARQRGMQVYETGAEALPFADASFDSVLMVTTICFFFDPLHALRETRRVLKPRGHIVIGMIDKDSPLGKSYEAKKRESTFYRYAHFYSVAQVISWLKQLGFGAIKTRQTILKPLRPQIYLLKSQRRRQLNPHCQIVSLLPFCLPLARYSQQLRLCSRWYSWSSPKKLDA